MNKTTRIVREAMKIVRKDVQTPKVVRDGIIKDNIDLLLEDILTSKRIKK